MKAIYLQNTSQFTCLSSIPEKELKAQLKNDFNHSVRRASRLTLLALLGASSLKPEKQCGVYVASNFNSPTNMQSLQQDVFQQKMPRPFHFINSINNAVSFYVAQILNITGPNLFQATTFADWSQILLPAIVDLQLGIVQQALVGWCYELHQQSIGPKQEGSHWLLLSTQAENAMAQWVIQQSDHEKACNKNECELNSEDYFYSPVIDFIANIENREGSLNEIHLIGNKKITVYFNI